VYCLLVVVGFVGGGGGVIVHCVCIYVSVFLQNVSAWRIPGHEPFADMTVIQVRHIAMGGVS
jgi:hypothetical protein